MRGRLVDWLSFYRENRVSVQFVVAVSVLGIAVDFFSRVAVFRDRQGRPEKAPPTIVVRPFLEPDAVRGRMRSALPEVVRSDAAVEKQFKLLAIFRSVTGASAAIHVITPGSEGTPLMRVVRSAEDVEGWRVEAIEARRLLLRRDSEEKELVLFRGKEP